MRSRTTHRDMDKEGDKDSEGLTGEVASLELVDVRGQGLVFQ